MNNNNIFTISGLNTTEINLFPQTIVEEIIQNIRMLLTTVIGSVPLDRGLGLNATFVDEPAPRGIMKASIFVLETIQEHEPRVEVMEVDFVPSTDAALDGKFYPRVVVRILNEYLE